MRSSYRLLALRLGAALAAGFSLLTCHAAATGGYSTATGSSAPGVTVYNLAELQNAINAGDTHIIISGSITANQLTTFTFATTSWNNTTIEGAAGGQAVLENIQLKFDGEELPSGTNIQNIIIRNITFYGYIPTLQALPQQVVGTSNNVGINYLGVSIRRCTNVWLDHCTLYNTSDDLFCINLASDDVTVSYCHFYFSVSWMDMNPDPMWAWYSPSQFNDLANERIAAVIGANKSDSYTYGGGHLHVTIHHCWFGPYMKGRPLCRGFIHAYNNYFDNTGQPNGLTAAGYSETQYNAFQIGSGSVIYSESNYYYLTNNSNQVGLDSSGDAWTFYERNNQYHGTTGSSQAGAAFPSQLPFPYSYSPEATGNVPNDVETNAGPH